MKFYHIFERSPRDWETVTKREKTSWTQDLRVKQNHPHTLIYFYFHQLGPLGQVGQLVTESVCLFICLFVPFPCNIF